MLPVQAWMPRVGYLSEIEVPCGDGRAHVEAEARRQQRQVDIVWDLHLPDRDLLVVVDEADRYAGIVLLPEAYAPTLDDKLATTTLDALLRYRDALLLPSMNVKEAAAVFERAEADALVVVEDAERRHVLGLLTEQHALRRYSEELDQRRRELAGEI